MLSYQSGPLCGSNLREAEEENPGRYAAEPKHELTEVFVLGHQDRVSPIRLVEYLLVRCRRAEIGDMMHLMPVSAELENHLPVYALVADEDQAAASGAG